MQKKSPPKTKASSKRTRTTSRRAGGKRSVFADALATNDSAEFWRAISELWVERPSLRIAGMSDGIRMLWLASTLASALRLDLLHSFVYNDAEAFHASALQDWCQVIDAPRARDCIAAMLALFPGGVAMADDAQRHAFVERLQTRVPSPFAALSARYADAYAELAERVRAFILDNQTSLETEYAALRKAPASKRRAAKRRRAR